MPPKKEKEAIFIVLDIGANTAVLDNSGKSFLSRAKECIYMIIQRKLFSTSSDELGLIVFGSDETRNTLAGEDDNGYQNISVISGLKLASWDLLRYIENVKNTDCVGDWIDAIIVAMQCIRDETELKDFIQTKIVLLSNFSTDVSDDQIEIIVNGMENMGINLVAIGPDVLQGDKSEGMKKPESQITGECLISRIVTELKNSVICSFDDAIPELMYFQRKSVRPAAWNTNFVVSNSIKIPISGYKKVADIPPIKWANEAIDDKSVLVTKDRAYMSYDTNKGIEVIVNKPDIIEAYEFGDTLVPFSNVDKEAMNYKSGKKGLYFLGCAKKESIPLHMLLGTGNYVITNRKGDQSGKVALEAFIVALHKQNKVGIAKRIYVDNSSALIGALFPIITEEHRYLVYAELPFAEDEHIYMFPSLSTIPARTESQKKAVSDFIDSMDLDETENQPERYEPAKTYSPREQYLYHCLTFKALHPNEPVPDNISDNIKSMLQPAADLVEKCKPALSQIKDSFNIKDEVIEAEQKITLEVESMEDEVREVKDKAKFTGKIGTTHPDKDFEYLISERTKRYKVYSEMEEVIVKLLSLSPEDVDKPLQALQVLRQFCISEGSGDYNQWIIQFKDFLREQNNNKFWDALVTGNLGLITDTEAPGCVTTKLEADEFSKSLFKTETCSPDELLDEL